MPEPSTILDLALSGALESDATPVIADPVIAERLAYVIEISPYTSYRNASGIRVLLACALAKSHRPDIDIRKPYTEIGAADAYSGRTYDEAYITGFIDEHRLPANSTTAWLTPAWRNLDTVLERDVEIVGRPRRLYVDTINLLNDVYEGKITAEDLLTETIRRLIAVRNARANQVSALLEELRQTERDDAIPLSGEDIVTIISQHLRSKNASRLPVLVVAAAYKVAQEHLEERVLPLEAHSAADRQTGALGDVEITLVDDNEVITSYEMKDKRVTINDINHALSKIRKQGKS